MFFELKILLCGVLLPGIVSGRYTDNYGIENKWRQSSLSREQIQDLQCAVVYDQPNYQGRSSTFGDGDQLGQWGAQFVNFRPQSVRVQGGCSVTLFDWYGTAKSFQDDTQWIWGWNYPAVSACCQCGGCEGKNAYEGNDCARLYEHERCNGCDGYRLNLRDGDRARHFGPIDNTMSSIAVRPGCHAIAYYESDFKGYRVNFTRSINLFGDNWNKHISSVECTCPSTWPGVTIPTVPTNPPVTVTIPTWTTNPPVKVTIPTWPPTTAPTRPPVTVTIPTAWPTTTPTEYTYVTAPMPTESNEWGSEEESSTFNSGNGRPESFPTLDPGLESGGHIFSEEEEEPSKSNLDSGIDNGFSDEDNDSEDDDNDDEDDDAGWSHAGAGSEEEITTMGTTTTTTTTTPKPTTTRTTTTTTEEPESESFPEENEEKEDDWEDW